MCAPHEEEDVVVVWRKPKKDREEKKKKSAKACFQIWELPRSLQLTRKSLFMSLLLLRRTKKKHLWGELLTGGEGETEFIRLAVVFAHRELHKVTLKVKPAGHCCGRGYGVDVCLDTELKIHSEKTLLPWKAAWCVLKPSNKKCECSTADAAQALKNKQKKTPTGPGLRVLACPRLPRAKY